MSKRMADKAELEKAIRLINTDGIREAVALLQPLANRDSADAIFILACIGTSDETVDQFEARHVMMLQRAAELGQRSAIYSLYLYRDTGEHKELLPKDPKEALRLLSQAFDLGHRDAIYQFGVMYLFGTPPVPPGTEQGTQFD